MLYTCIRRNRLKLLRQVYQKCLIDILIFFPGTSSGITPILSSFVVQVAIFAIGKCVLRFTKNWYDKYQ